MEGKRTNPLLVYVAFLLTETPQNSEFMKYSKKIINYSSVIRQLRSKLRRKWKLGPEGEQLVLSLEVCFGSKISSEQREPAAKAATESNLAASDKDRLTWRVRWAYAGCHHVPRASCRPPAFGKEVPWLYCTLEPQLWTVAASATSQLCHTTLKEA